MAKEAEDEMALAALQSQHNELKEKVEAFLARENTSASAARITALEDLILLSAELVSDTQLACFRTDKLSTVKALERGAAEIEARRKKEAEDATQN